MNINELKSLKKERRQQLAQHLDKTEIRFLVQTLTEKDDMIRYNALLLLQANSRQFPLTYEHWDELAEKLDNLNSYQRSIGLMLISENVRWDNDGKFDKIIHKYIRCCTDEKFITSRQAIQGLANVLSSTDEYDDKIREGLTHLSLSQYKENQQKLLNKDISNILGMIKSRPKT